MSIRVTLTEISNLFHSNNIINIVASLVKYEILIAFVNGQDSTVIRKTLIEMAHLQLHTKSQVDNIVVHSST